MSVILNTTVSNKHNKNEFEKCIHIKNESMLLVLVEGNWRKCLKNEGCKRLEEKWERKNLQNRDE